MDKKQNYKILIDARKLIDGRPLALEKICGSIWVSHLINAIKDANLLSQTEIMLPQGHENEFDATVKDKSLRVFNGRVEELNDFLIIGVDRIFALTVLTRLLKSQKKQIAPALISRIETKADFLKAEEFVSRDEGLITSRRLNMPAAKKIALMLSHTSISPNQVTLLSMLAGLLAAALAAQGGYLFDVSSAIALQIALTLDLSDGYLARLTNRSSYFGHWLDTFVDSIMNISIILGVVFGTVRVYGWMPWMFFGAVWLVCFHAQDSSYWFTQLFSYTKGVGTLGESENPSSDKPSAYSLRKMVGRIIYFVERLDTKFHVISLFLILNLKVALVPFMATVYFLSSFSKVIYQYQKHGQAGG